MSEYEHVIGLGRTPLGVLREEEAEKLGITSGETLGSICFSGNVNYRDFEREPLKSSRINRFRGRVLRCRH